MLKTSDTLVLGADALKDNINIDLKEIVRLKHDSRNGMRIRDLDISWQTIIVMVRHNGAMIVAKGALMLLADDHGFSIPGGESLMPAKFKLKSKGAAYGRLCI